MSVISEKVISTDVVKPARVAKRKRFVLRRVPWNLYRRLRNIPENRHTRMTYLDGTLILMAPEFRHEVGAERLGVFIRAVAEECNIPFAGARSTTFSLKQPGERKGAAKEPDNSFYFANEAQVRDKHSIDLEIDPPPDLAIEVDNTRSSLAKLTVYARLGIPEVWRYDVNRGTLWFGQLTENGTYQEIDQSISLPMLTPAIVLEQLQRCLGRAESEWGRLIRVWVRETLADQGD